MSKSSGKRLSEDIPDNKEKGRVDFRDPAPVIELLRNIKQQLPILEELLDQISGHWNYEDGLYRYYHHSLKVYYRLQPETKAMVAALKSVMPERELNPMFLRIVSEGTGKEFSMDFNEFERWQKEGRPVCEAFLHAKYFLEMIVKYGKKCEKPPSPLPSGWAAVLCLYGLR